MNREETLALWRQGKDAWNAWAEKMLAERKRLEETGEWAAASTADFSSKDDPFTFEADVDFSGLQFPGDARFGSATFSGDAGFDSATFSGDARFGSATFSGDAWFDSATFSGDARFGSATFSGDAWFDSATFSGDAGFDSATFSGFAGFAGSTFQGFTTFPDAKFGGPTDFTAIKSERAFTIENATFKKVPDFIQANFSEAPRLDNSHFRPGFVEPGRFWGLASRVKRLFGGDRDVPARWRALKRLAIQGHDHEREQLFFPMEIRSARFVTDWPLHWKFWDAGAWGGVFRFWFGWLYQFTSDFGRSVLRPALLLFATILAFAAIYLGESQRAGPEMARPWTANASDLAARYDPTPLSAGAGLPAANHPCTRRREARSIQPLEGELARRTSAAAEALHLAVTNASVIGGIGGPDAARRTYGCLFGLVRDGGGNTAPIVPAAVSNWSLIQKTISLVLIFLLGLAIRNMLKVR